MPFRSLQVSVTRSIFALFLALISAPVAWGGSMLLIGVGSAGGAAPPASGWCGKIPQSGLVNCWPFDTVNTTTSVATDVIGGKNATLSNVTLAGSGPSSNLNNAGVFNGTSSIGATTLANLPTTTFSLVMWINTNTNNGGRAIANDHTDGDDNGFQVITSAGFSSQLYLGNGSSNVSTNANGLPSDTWTMMSWTWDGTTMTGYSGGSSTSSSTFSGPITAGSGDVTFGSIPGGLAFYTGQIAGVAIYNRVLTPTEIATINGL